MMRLILSVALLVATGAASSKDAPPDELVKKLTGVIREYCPDASILVTNGLFRATYGTMMFTLHGRQKDGEILTETHQQEGPNFKGFLLGVSVEKGPYGGQAVVPQELHGPYFASFIDGPATEDGKNHYWIVFSYGSRLDPRLKQAIFAALPRRKFQQSDGANRVPR